MSQAMFKNTVTSPVARSFMKRPMNPRSILRRPAALPMSPTTQPVFASFSVMASPSLKSPHVQFMASPQLVATFTTHSSDTYDRAPIRVSPNPLELPGRGDRYYSPALENFRLADPPKPKAAVQKRLDSIIHQQCASPAITEFEDPRSPKVPVDASQSVRFSSFVASPARPARDLKASISSFPRSPYPSATLPSEVEASEDGVRARRMSDSSVDVSTRPAAVSTAPRKALAPRLPSSLPSIPSPLQQSFRTPVKTPLTAGLQRSHKPAPLAISPQEDATALSDAFWDAMSLQETPMVTALEYPESAMDMEEVSLKSPAPAVKSPGPALIFGTQDGGVWSPSAPKQPAARESLLRSALMSPGKVAFARVKRSDIAAPSPNDPFASFPSFAAALTMAQSDPTIAYPAPVAVAA